MGIYNEGNVAGTQFCAQMTGFAGPAQFVLWGGNHLAPAAELLVRQERDELADTARWAGNMSSTTLRI